MLMRNISGIKKPAVITNSEIVQIPKITNHKSIEQIIDAHILSWMFLNPLGAEDIGEDGGVIRTDRQFNRLEPLIAFEPHYISIVNTIEDLAIEALKINTAQRSNNYSRYLLDRSGIIEVNADDIITAEPIEVNDDRDRAESKLEALETHIRKVHSIITRLNSATEEFYIQRREPQIKAGLRVLNEMSDILRHLAIFNDGHTMIRRPLRTLNKMYQHQNYREVLRNSTKQVIEIEYTTTRKLMNALYQITTDENSQYASDYMALVKQINKKLQGHSAVSIIQTPVGDNRTRYTINPTTIPHYIPLGQDKLSVLIRRFAGMFISQ